MNSTLVITWKSSPALYSDRIRWDVRTPYILDKKLQGTWVFIDNSNKKSYLISWSRWVK